jgi:hypothetical protein
MMTIRKSGFGSCRIVKRNPFLACECLLAETSNGTNEIWKLSLRVGKYDPLRDYLSVLILGVNSSILLDKTKSCIPLLVVL